MARLSNGDRSAFEPLFRTLHPRALRFARSRLAPDRADDVAQAAMVRVFGNAHRFIAGSPALPWFYAIVANELRSAKRQLRNHTVATDHPAAAASEMNGEDAVLTQELRRALVLAVDALDEASAAAIRGHLGEPEPKGVAAPTLRKRISRAYARLRLSLGEFR